MGQALRGHRVGGGAGGCATASTLSRRFRALVAGAVLASCTLLATNVPAQAVGEPLSVPGGVSLTGGRFTIVAGSRDARLARTLLVSAQASDSFPGLPHPRERVLIAVAPDAQHFRAWVGPGAPEWGAAIAIPALHRIIMQGSSAGSDAGDPQVVLRHELAHLALHEFMGTLPPHWFDEGFASVAAGEWSRENAFETSITLSWRTMPGVSALDDGFTAGASRAEWSYALAQRAVAELQALDRERGLANFFVYWRESGSFDLALRQAYGLTTDGFDALWHKATQRRYGALAVVANLSLIFGALAVVLGPLYWMRRRRDRRRLEAMRAADAVQEAAQRESALTAMLALEGESSLDPNSPGAVGTPSLDTTWRPT